MQKLPNWEFVSTGGGPEEGIHNPMIEHFLGNYNYSLAREIIQNSIDARMDKNEPVKVIFKLDYYKVEDIPGHKKLYNVFKDCKLEWNGRKDSDDFFDLALMHFKKEKIPVLKKYLTTIQKG